MWIIQDRSYYLITDIIDIAKEGCDFACIPLGNKQRCRLLKAGKAVSAQLVAIDRSQLPVGVLFNVDKAIKDLNNNFDY